MNDDYNKVVNLTGHDITVIQWNNERVTLESDGYLRVDSDMENVSSVRVDGLRIPLLEITERMSPDGLPPPSRNTLYVVSGIVAAKVQRDDFAVPARVTRNSIGTVAGCRAFARVRK